MGAIGFFGARPGISTSETSSTSSTSSTGSSSDNSDGAKGRIAKDTAGVFGHVFDPEAGETDEVQDSIAMQVGLRLKDLAKKPYHNYLHDLAPVHIIFAVFGALPVLTFLNLFNLGGEHVALRRHRVHVPPHHGCLPTCRFRGLPHGPFSFQEEQT